MMSWKKRRRYPLRMISMICASCTVIFLFANVLLLNSDISRMLESTARDLRQSLQSSFHRDPGSTDIQHTEESDKWQPLLRENIIETRLRKLMENTQNGVQISGIKDRTTRPVSSADILYMLSQNSDCEGINNASMKMKKFIASGWTKAVYKVDYRGEHVALKTVDLDGHDMGMCLQQPGSNRADCYTKSSQKLIKEIVLLRGLLHNNIVKVKGYCVPSKSSNSGDDFQISMATELGETIDIIRLLQMSWEDRLRVAYGISRLLYYIATSPFGSLSLNDFRRQQFVLVNGEVKMTDVDDVGFDEPSCTQDKDCTLHFSTANTTIRVPCQHGVCEGYNEKRNIFNAARHFTTFLLPHGAPPALKPSVDKLVDAFSNVTMGSHQLLQGMANLVEDFISGRYLDRSAPQRAKNKFECLEGHDLPGQYDYRCRLSLSGSGCTISVFDQREAEEICSADFECQGFVMTNDKTWTGRIITHLKNGRGHAKRNAKTRLCIKPELPGI